MEAKGMSHILVNYCCVTMHINIVVIPIVWSMFRCEWASVYFV